MKLGLDELMIVNPGPAPPRRARPPGGSWFLGADGGLYHVDHPGAPRRGDGRLEGSALGAAQSVPRFFLGEDGTLYERR